jgi:fermentation-respiration switch protein FrsA (DUF1100 family)
VLLVAAAAGCGDDDARAKQTTGLYAVGTRSVTFVDESRETPAFGDLPARPNRTLVTDVWYPARGDPGSPTTADAREAEGPFPVIVFNHGQQGEPQQYTLSFEAWARGGYVVVAPRHPLTVRGGSGAQFVHDMQGEIGDVPFVIDNVEDELGDLVDMDHLAVAGHSSGAIVAFGTGFNSCCHDDRVDAVLVEALLPIPLADGEYTDELKGTPVMLVHGTGDIYFPLDRVRDEFDRAAPPKFFLTLDGGNHSDSYRVGAHAEHVAAAALAFFDFSLKDRSGALDSLEANGVESVPG